MAGGRFLRFCLRDAVTLLPTVVLTLVTDGVYETLQQAVVMAETAPKHHAQYGIYHFYAKGTSGERVEVQRFEDANSSSS